MPERPRPAASAIRLTAALSTTAAALFWWLGGLIPEEPWIQRADNAGILLGLVLASLAAGGGITGLVYRAQIRTWWRRTFGRRDARAGAPLDIADKVQAIILPVSRSEQPSWIIHHLQPDHVGLLFSETSREQAYQIEREHRDRTIFEPSVAELEYQGRRLDDAHDLRESKHLTEWFIRRFRDELRIPRHRIFVDTTGGTKPMSLGAFQAAEEARVSSIYVQGRAAPPGSTDASLILDPGDREHGDPRFMSDWTSPTTKR
jgi:hypothetical protein